MLTTMKILAILNLIAFMLSMAYYENKKISSISLLIFFATALLTSLIALTL